MPDNSLYRGWAIRSTVTAWFKQILAYVKLSREARDLQRERDSLEAALHKLGLSELHQHKALATQMALRILTPHVSDTTDRTSTPIFAPLVACLHGVITNEQFLLLPTIPGGKHKRSDMWEISDHIRRSRKILACYEDALSLIETMVADAVAPLIKQQPSLVTPNSIETTELTFTTPLIDNLSAAPELVEHIMLLPFAAELDALALTTNLRARLEYNAVIASGKMPGDPQALNNVRLPTKLSSLAPQEVVDTYLAGTPWMELFSCAMPVSIPEATRFEHQFIVAGSGHGKTQTLQHLILHDLDAVAAGRASIVVIDSQSDLIRNISSLAVFAEGSPLADRLCIIDPTDIEWPVALNLFDVGKDRINDYSPLDQERLTNSIIELYDFVLGSLLDASMTQKQSVIFRYVTRLMLHIPGATIHTFRELLEPGGYTAYQTYIEKLSGSARAFFQTEFQSKDFSGTKQQVLRRLYGILENQTFERMFSHPKSKLDLFSEMNAGKVILINTAKDLLKENGTEIFGRFFIAMIAQAAQERATLTRDDRLPTFVYIDEASDYFDRNIGTILSQARKQNVGLICASQQLGQMNPKLQETMLTNTSIKFAGGLSAKDARAMAAEMRTDAGFIERQDKLSFAAFVKGTTQHAISVSVAPGEMEKLPRMGAAQRSEQRQAMRDAYAVCNSEIDTLTTDGIHQSDVSQTSQAPSTEEDDGTPMAWE